MEDVPEHVIFLLSAAPEGCVAGYHLIEDHTVAPPVGSLPVLPAGLNHENLRSHVVGCPTESCGQVGF